jgi:hypothetical protein
MFSSTLQARLQGDMREVMAWGLSGNKHAHSSKQEDLFGREVCLQLQDTLFEGLQARVA